MITSSCMASVYWSPAYSYWPPSLCTYYFQTLETCKASVSSVWSSASCWATWASATSSFPSLHQTSATPTASMQVYILTSKLKTYWHLNSGYFSLSPLWIKISKPIILYVKSFHVHVFLNYWLLNTSLIYSWIYFVLTCSIKSTYIEANKFKMMTEFQRYFIFLSSRF